MADEKITEERTEPQQAEAGERTEGRTAGRRRARRRSAKRAERPADGTAQSAAPVAGPGENAAEQPAGKPAGRAEEKSAAARKAEKPAGGSRVAQAAAKSARTARERRQGRGESGAQAAKRASGPSSARGGSGWRWRDDLRQLAIVVIGVALTIGIPECIGGMKQRREERQVMQQVYEELQGNRVQIALRDAAVRTDALETLRSSAAAVSRCDKALLRDIYFCYSSIRRREVRMAGDGSDDAATLDARIGRTLTAIDERYGFER